MPGAIVEALFIDGNRIHAAKYSIAWPFLSDIRVHSSVLVLAIVRNLPLRNPRVLSGASERACCKAPYWR